MHRQYIVSTLLAFCISASLGYAQSRDAANDCYERASSHYKKGNLDAAIAEFTRAIELSSHLVKPGRNLGQMEAAFNFDRVRVLDPIAARAYANRGMIRFLKRDYDSAIDDCNRAIEIE